MLIRKWNVHLLALGVLWLGVFAAGNAPAATWNFSATGSDSGNGSAASPWNNPANHNGAYQPGDVLSIGPGIYTPSWGWQLTASGSAAGGYITLRCAPNHASHIVATNPWISGIVLTHGASYWDITGCDVSAPGLQDTGIGVSGQFSAPFGPLTHIIVENNVVHDSSCNGISAAGNTNGGQPVDYLIFRNNVVYGNAKTSGYDCSGISIYEPRAYDEAPGYHLLIQQNISYSNFDCGSCHAQTTDGNGIILDDFASTQNPGTPYQPGTLVENNLVFNNGGNGIHAFESENVTIRSNTAWGDVQDNKHCSGGYEVGAALSNNIQFYDNLTQATRSVVCTSRVYAMGIYGVGNSTGIVSISNLDYGVGGNNYVISGAPGTDWEKGNWNGVNPKLVSPLRPTGAAPVSEILASFVPATGSSALRPYGGSIKLAPAVDMLDDPRRTRGNADIGCIQVGP